MGDAKESGGRWWEGEGAAGFNFTEDNEGDNTDDYTCLLYTSDAADEP